MITLVSNILSQKQQRQLGSTSSELSKVSERLSTGQRINRGSDDAAGLSVAKSLEVSTRIYSQGLRNLSDGISMVTIAEGALGELSDIATRIQELAAQAANGSFSSAQRESLQKEVTALQSEWNRIVEGTTFNGVQLLTGSNTRVVLQGGKGTDGTLALQIGEQALAEGFDNFAGGTTRGNTSSSGGEANSDSQVTGITPDGRYVVFRSTATNLVSGDTNGWNDIFRKDLWTGELTRVSTSSSGIQGNSHADSASISADGRYVAFSSTADNLVAGDTNGQSDIFLKDMQTGELTRVSTSSSGAQANGGGLAPSISADGRYVAFSSTASNLVAGDTNGVADIFVKDLQTGAVTRASTSSAGGEGGGNSIEASISADGRFVAFQSDANDLVSGDSANTDIFVKDLQTGLLTMVSTTAAGISGDNYSYTPEISADGKFVTFMSMATNLATVDTNGNMDVFRKDLETGILTCVSALTTGEAANGYSGVASISADGRYVSFFSDATDLVSGDTNGVGDVFVKDLQTGTITLVSTNTSGQQANSISVANVISADGRYIAFNSSATNLVSGDTNGADDLFLRDLRRAGIQQMAGMVVNNAASAKVTLELARSYREEISTYRANLGVSSSRIRSFSQALESTRLNYEDAYGRIVDSDIVEESAKLISLTIRQQTAVALAAQANQMTGIAIELLKYR